MRKKKKKGPFFWQRKNVYLRQGRNKPQFQFRRGEGKKKPRIGRIMIKGWGGKGTFISLVAGGENKAFLRWLAEKEGESRKLGGGQEGNLLGRKK